MAEKKKNNFEKISKPEFMSGIVDELTEHETTDYFKGRMIARLFLYLNDYVDD